jgi:hypothetical protein
MIFFLFLKLVQNFVFIFVDNVCILSIYNVFEFANFSKGTKAMMDAVVKATEQGATTIIGKYRLYCIVCSADLKRWNKIKILWYIKYALYCLIADMQFQYKYNICTLS